MATTITRKITEYDTLHKNGPWPAEYMHSTSIDGRLEQADFFQCYNDAAAEIQRLLDMVRAKGEGFRAIGSSWSLNHIGQHDTHMHFNRGMNLRRAISVADVHAQSSYKSENLFFFQCGTRVKEINNYLFTFGKSLKTSGASNGQTIAGCISTGVHGSAHDVGSMQDYVVGLNLIIGPGPNDIVYLEPASKSALSDAFAAQIRARVIRNDELFHAALVGLGSFGFIHGIVIEVEDLFLLNRYVTSLDRAEAFRLAGTLDFRNSSFRIPGEVDALGKPNMPHHFKVFMNPYRHDAQLRAEIIYKKPYRKDYPDPIPRVRKALYTEFIAGMGNIIGRIPNRIPALSRMLEGAALPPENADPNTPVTGTHAEIFFDSLQQGPAFACEFCVPLDKAVKAYELLSALCRNEGPVPGLFAMRFIRKSEALLGCPAFPYTCMLEIDGVIWRAKKKDLSLQAFCKRSIQVLQGNQIPFTMHWGKTADWAYPGIIEYMYGEKAKRWREYRSALLSKEMAQVFSNKFLDETGLSEYVDNAPVALAKSTI
ncbi:MAG: FAD-binding protein [Bacteroidetes bacterium]|nr:FAD-binding protein [Bacteroidota bacterium]